MRNKEMNKSCNLTLFFGRNNLVTHLNNTSVGSNPKFNEIYYDLVKNCQVPLTILLLNYLNYVHTRFSEQKWSDGPRLLNREKLN